MGKEEKVETPVKKRGRAKKEPAVEASPPNPVLEAYKLLSAIPMKSMGVQNAIKILHKEV